MHEESYEFSLKKLNSLIGAMDAETELKLYDHVEFLDPSNGANESKVGNVVRTKTTANSKKKKKNKNKNQQKVGHSLNLQFFTK